MLIITHKVIPQVHSESVEYKDGETVLEGYISYDESFTGTRPAVLIVHEWTGLNDYSKMRADMLARLGYFAFAVDIYGKGIRPDNPQDAGKQASIYKSDRKLMRSRILAGLEELKKQKLADVNNIGAIGYCFGGTVVLELARSGAEIKGVVSFHGGLDTPNPEDTKNIKSKILVCHGAADPYVPAEQVKAFEEEMNKAGADYKIISYEGAVHSFTNPKSGNDPSKGAAYDERADRKSWGDMKEFFKDIFGK
ncbi:MAG: dienelactone hydrolase family protein [Ignavibacteria bacterium]|nr:dienelactone hydrolase family protein [Ignavibacteria bacterium]